MQRNETFCRSHSILEADRRSAKNITMTIQKRRKSAKSAGKEAKKVKRETFVISGGEDVENLTKSIESVKIEPTEEQINIIKHQASCGKVVRVIAGAGTGKTSTMLLLAKELLEKKERVLYLVFNKQAQLDAQAKFSGLSGLIHCKTLHSAAKSNITVPDPSFRGLDHVVDEWPFRKQIAEDFGPEIGQWLLSRTPSEKEKSKKENLEGKIELVVFWIYKTLEGWLRSAFPESKLSDNFMTYFPAKLNHEKYLGFENFGTFYIEKAALIWKKIWSGKYPVSHDVYMKYAQLGHCNLNHYTAILLDESQDTTACQVDLFVQQQSDKKVFVVGDAAQTIYSFRGAKSKFVVDLRNTQDYRLTNSFRFGKNVQFVANQFLWMKEKSPQAHLFNPYRLVGKGKHDGEIFDSSSSLPYPYTFVARANSTSIFYSFSLLANDENVTIAINGDIPKFQTTIKKVLDLYLLYKNQKPQRDEYRKYKSFDDFKIEVERLERNDELILIKLIETYKEDLPEKMNTFKEMVLDKEIPLSEADVILTTGN
jgi:AAA domain